MYLILGAVAAMIWANSPFADSYEAFAHFEPLKGLAIFLFFLTLGIELRHEITHGSLAKPRQAVVPIFAALGGMAVPVIIYSLINDGLPTAAGWGVPMSTDVAFALAIFAIAAKGLPKQLRAFVLTVAVVDDSLTILMIAVFFTANFHLLSVVSLAGVIIGIFMPKGELVLGKLENVVKFGALPIFALMSAGVSLESFSIEKLAGSTITLGVLAAMLIGKPLGVIGTAWLVTKTGLGKLVANLKWADMLSIAPLFGMCFTVALLMSELSFGNNDDWHDTANLSVFIGSTIMALVATLTLNLRKSSFARQI
jgi:NhaA family Na+:H+ antiporter